MPWTQVIPRTRPPYELRMIAAEKIELGQNLIVAEPGEYEPEYEGATWTYVRGIVWMGQLAAPGEAEKIIGTALHDAVQGQELRVLSDGVGVPLPARLADYTLIHVPLAP